MSEYAQLLDGMMEAILANDATHAASLVRDKKDFPREAQLGVYTQGYRMRLAEAVQSTYPATHAALGEAAFGKLAADFIAAHPSRSFNLDKYPIAFAAYVSGDAFICELAQLEGTIHDVYQREESPAADADWTQRQMPQALASATLALREAAVLLACAYPVNGYLSAFRAGKNPAVPAPLAHWLIVLRHRNQVHRLGLEEGEYALLSLLDSGLTLEQALEDERLAAFVAQEDFAPSLTGWLSRWVNAGILRKPM